MMDGAVLIPPVNSVSEFDDENERRIYWLQPCRVSNLLQEGFSAKQNYESP